VPELDVDALAAVPDRGQSTAADLQRSLIRPAFLLAELSSKAKERVALPEDEEEGEFRSPASHKTVDLLFPWYRSRRSMPAWKRYLAMFGTPVG